MDNIIATAKEAISALLNCDQEAVEVTGAVIEDVGMTEDELYNLDEESWQLFLFGFGCGAAYSSWQHHHDDEHIRYA